MMEWEAGLSKIDINGSQVSLKQIREMIDNKTLIPNLKQEETDLDK